MLPAPVCTTTSTLCPGVRAGSVTPSGTVISTGRPSSETTSGEMLTRIPSISTVPAGEAAEKPWSKRPLCSNSISNSPISPLCGPSSWEASARPFVWIVRTLRPLATRKACGSRFTTTARSRVVFTCERTRSREPATLTRSPRRTRRDATRRLTASPFRPVATTIVPVRACFATTTPLIGFDAAVAWSGGEQYDGDRKQSCPFHR